jgi:transposase-like protein
MSRITESQAKLGAQTKERIVALGLEQGRIARELDRSDVAVHRALKGERKVLLDRIIRWLNRYENRKQSTKSKAPQAA